MLSLTIEEVAEMLSGWADLPSSHKEAVRDVEEWVEHMRAGGFDRGHDYTPDDDDDD